ncbi:hypothetical protein V6N13_094345 [Hibiscus sabdariffa]
MLRYLMGLDGKRILMAFSHQKHISITRPSAQDHLMESGSKCGQAMFVNSSGNGSTMFRSKSIERFGKQVFSALCGLAGRIETMSYSRG